MDPHERFMKHYTSEGTYLIIHIPTYSNILINMVGDLNSDVRAKYEYSDSLRNLRMMRTVLCSFYQHKNKPKDCPEIFEKHLSYHSVNELKVEKIQKLLYTQLNAASSSYSVEVSVVLDILILHMTLFSRDTTIWKYLERLLDMIHYRFVEDKRLKPLDIKLMDCYMDSLLLHQRNPQSTAEVRDVEVTALFLEVVKIWLTLKDHKDYQLLTLLLPKLMKLVPQSDILTKIWKVIFESQNDPLSMLCQTADVWFPIQSNGNQVLINQAMEESFWLALLKGLSSPIPQQRKEALTLIRRVVDFANKRKSRGLKLGSYQEIGPLLCIGNESQQSSFEENLKNFLLIIEATEAKPKHLATPLLESIKTLRNTPWANAQGNCQTGLHIAWIRCAFTRILQHDDEDTVKCGLLNCFTLDPELYNDDFLSVVLDSLNNTKLYENYADQEEPTVVKELINLLNNAETKNGDLVNRLVVEASKMTWGSVAVYYVIHALSMVKRICSVWQKVELYAVKSLAELKSNIHCQILCIGTQIELLEILTRYVTQWPGLVAVANTLSAFSTSEALIRGQLSWKRISAWLSKILKEEEALHFLEIICKQLANESSEGNLTMKSFSLIIMLFHDGHLILNSELCPGLTTLRNLLNCLIGADSRPHANANLRTRSIELINHLLGFTTSKDYILCELISNYVDATLRVTLKVLRNTFDEAYNIDTYVSITQEIFTAQSLIISKKDALNHIDRFEAESLNIIDDGGWSNNVQRLFGLKILYACLQANSAKLKNYKFIGPLYNTYSTLKLQSPKGTADVNQHSSESQNSASNIAAEYHKLVADLFHEYLKAELVDVWIPQRNWIEQVLYLLKVGSKDILVSLIGILSQLFYKGVIRGTNIDNFKSATRLCWKSILESNECQSALEEFIYLIFSSPFLERKETRELTMECTNELLNKADGIPELKISLMKGLKQVNAGYLLDFYDAVIACLLDGTDLNRDQIIELQTRLYILDCYQAVHPNYLSNMNANTNAVIRAHAVTLLHKMITDDPMHAAKLLPLIVARLDESQKKENVGVSRMNRSENRIMQVLLVLQPMLEKDDIGSLHSLICNMSESSQPSVRMMQEWLLMRIYLESETLRAKIWDLFDQGQKKRMGSLCSLMSVVYHVARILPSPSQVEFINSAFQYIVPYCMAQQFSVRSHSQVVVSKLYDLATDMSYSTLTEKYREVYIPLMKSLKDESLNPNSMKLQDEFCFKLMNPIDHYSLKTIFYDLPTLSNVSFDEYITPQMFEKFGFKESNSHPLKLLNLQNDMNKAQVSEHMLESSGNRGSETGGINSSEDCSDNIQKKFVLLNGMTPDELGRMPETSTSCQNTSMSENSIILVASLIDEQLNLRICKILGAEKVVVSSTEHTGKKQFQRFSGWTEKPIPLEEVKPDQLLQYLLEKKQMGYRLVGAEQTVNTTSLMDIKFHQKTVILLGNEKAGIPVDLINLLDECMKIP